MNSKDKKEKTDKQKYLEQIDQYYRHKLRTFDLICVGITPDILVKYGARKLPIVVRQSTITKCIRSHAGSRSAHELPRNIIESLPNQIETPIYIICDKERNSIIVISDAKDQKNNNILVAIKLDEIKNAKEVNEIKSIYGKTDLKEYLVKNAKKKQLHIIDKSKAENIPCHRAPLAQGVNIFQLCK